MRYAVQSAVTAGSRRDGGRLESPCEIRQKEDAFVIVGWADASSQRCALARRRHMQNSKSDRAPARLNARPLSLSSVPGLALLDDRCCIPARLRRVRGAQ